MRKIEIPWWLSLIIVLEVLPMFLGPWFALTGEFMGGGDVYQSYIYAARNLAVGVAFILAYFLKSAAMLFILILVRLLTDLIDLPTMLSFGLANNETRLVAIFVFFYYIPALIALRYLWNQIKKEA